MTSQSSIQLVPMLCLQCATPIPAEEQELAWVCEKCGQGMWLGPTGLEHLTVQWALSNASPRLTWQPFWSFTGTVQFRSRQTFGGRGEPDKLWAEPQRFFIPAFAASIQTLETLGADLLKKRLSPQAGPAAGKLPPCVMFPADAVRAAEFVVLTIEAERKDKLKSVDFTIEASAPELWVLGFEGEVKAENLAIQN